MAEFLTTKEILGQLERIIKTAEKRLVLITAYAKISDDFFERLRDADKRGVRIPLVLGKGKLPEEANRLQYLEHLSLYIDDNVHAKCFFNEESMVITSFNLLESSEKNREMGVLVRKKEDAVIFREAVKETESIVDSASRFDLRKEKLQTESPSATHRGYCIRCGASIPQDLERPFCRECFSEWAEWENPYYEESRCHTCGKPALTSRARPQCDECYSRLRG